MSRRERQKDLIWAVTTYRRQADLVIGKEIRRDRRTVGLYPTMSEAVTIVEGNYGDLEEAGWYQFAVIEPLPFGLYPVNYEPDRIWYEWVGLRNGRWVRLAPGTPLILQQEFHVGGLGGPRDFTNWSEVG